MAPWSHTGREDEEGGVEPSQDFWAEDEVEEDTSEERRDDGEGEEEDFKGVQLCFGLVYCEAITWGEGVDGCGLGFAAGTSVVVQSPGH